MRGQGAWPSEALGAQAAPGPAMLGAQKALRSDMDLDPVEAADALDLPSTEAMRGGAVRSVSMSDRPATGPWSEFMDEEPSVLEPFPLSSDDDEDEEESTTLIVSRTGDVLWITGYVMGLCLIGGTLLLVLAR
jgi:hypothetical protein